MNIELYTDKEQIKKGESLKFNIILTHPSSTELSAEFIPTAEIFPNTYLDIDLNSFNSNAETTLNKTDNGTIELKLSSVTDNTEITFNATALKNFDKNTAAVIIYDSCNESYAQTTINCSSHHFAFACTIAIVIASLCIFKRFI